MQQDYGHCLNFADGDIFRHILNARGRGDLVCEKKVVCTLEKMAEGSPHHRTTLSQWRASPGIYGAQCQHGPRLARVQLLQTTRN